MKTQTNTEHGSEGAVLRIVPLGGLGDIGKNMTLLEYQDDLIVIDVGSLFPTDDTPGVDLIIPDMEYLLERQDRLRAILLTHGHEDHIGALPHLLEFGVDVPIYGADLTISIVRSKLADEGASAEALRRLVPVDVRTRLELGPFQVEFFQVNHSFPSSMGISLQTPLGRVIHTGDFKFDAAPVIDAPLDEERLRQWGEEGVLLLMADSTNAEEDVATSSEASIEDKLQELFEQASGRVFLTTFASNISRVQQGMRLARRNGRRVGLVGRSMFRYVGSAIELEYLDVQWSDLLSRKDIENLPDEEVCVLITGSQGEPLSALSRMSKDGHRDHAIRPTDTVIISASPIPGNEVAFYSMVNRLFQLGADVIYSDLADIHVSGHGSQRENERMLELLRPRFFVPVHGEHRHLVLSRRHAIGLGMSENDVFVLEDGQSLEIGSVAGHPAARGARALAHRQAWLGRKVSAERILVDGNVISDDRQIVQERLWLRDGGMLNCVVLYDPKRKSIQGEPVLFSRGLLYPEEQQEFHAGARKVVARRLRRLMARQGGTQREWEKNLQGLLVHHCRQELSRRPVVVTRLIPYRT